MIRYNIIGLIRLEYTLLGTFFLRSKNKERVETVTTILPPDPVSFIHQL